MPVSSRRSACPFPTGAGRGGGEGSGGVSIDSIDSISLIGRGGQCRIPGRPPGGVAGQRYRLCVLVSGLEDYACWRLVTSTIRSRAVKWSVLKANCVPIMATVGTGRDAKTSRSAYRISTIAPQRHVGFDRILSFRFRENCGAVVNRNSIAKERFLI